ncbi:MAG: ABC transporter permease [candidate division Zixibacteria bacterium]|nr:ABC transporter permease [candidate division Zixibacteria bacterium]
MATRIFYRLLWGIVVLWGATTITFFVAHAVPSDPARVYAGANADAETVARIRKEMGLNDPLSTQYARYLGRLIRGDMGVSLVTGERVSEAIGTRLPTTLALAVTAVVLWMALSVPIGAFTALHRGRPLDRGVLVVATIAISLPVFWLARTLQYYLGYKSGIFPVAGMTSWKHILLPALTLAIVTAGYYARLVHTGMVETLNQDYIRVARAKGVSEPRVLFKHALRNGILPVVTVLGLDVATLLGGVVFTENVFALPGIGTLALQSVFTLDAPMIMGVVIFSAVMVVGANLLVDLLYGWIDPRIPHP